MKIPPYKIDSFIKNINASKELFGALIYGPESGLVNIYNKQIGQIIVPDLSDPFLVANLENKKIEEDNAILFDEFVSISMLGGRKLIKIDSASNKITNILKEIFDKNNKIIGQNFILISANNLDATSSLRKFAENSKYFACLACYEDNEQTIKNIIKNKLQEYSLRYEDGVLDVITDRFGKNRQIILNELEKLSIYMIGRDNFVTLEDASEVFCDISEISIVEFVEAFVNLDLRKSDFFLQKLYLEKVNVITIIRYLCNYFAKIFNTQNNLLSGSSIDQELKSQRIFFKQEQSFKKHLRIWNLKMVKNILLKLQELEIKCKTSNSKPEILLSAFNNFCFLKYKKS
jgi:DNA polymerase-3 subunit delta